MIKKRAAMISALVMLCTAGCGRIDYSAETTEETTDAEVTTTEEEITSEEITTAEETTAEAEITSEPTSETPQVSEDTDNTDKFNVITQLSLGMSKDEVFEIIGSDYDFELIKDHRSVVEYDYNFDTEEAFGTGLGGHMFTEFDEGTEKLVCCGYHIGAVAKDEHSCTYPYSAEQLEEAFNKILNPLNDEFGEATLNNDYEGEGIDTEYTWNADGEEIWAVWGTDMWGTSSGINEIIVSRSIDN